MDTRQRSLKTSFRNPGDALVENGLQRNQSVVVYRPDALKDGVMVEVTQGQVVDGAAATGSDKTVRL